MKIRYVLPAVFLLLLAMAFVVPGLGDYLIVLIWPVTIPLGFLSDALGGPRYIGIIGFLAGAGQFYVIGLIIDVIFRWLKKQPSEFDGLSKIAEKKARRNG